MIEPMTDLPAGVVGLRAHGEVTKDDYEQVIVPLLEQARRRGQKVRCLMHFPPGFEGFTPQAVWEDTKVGLRYLRLFERCAVVTDVDWIRKATRGVGAALPMPVRVFADADLEEAVSWVSSSVEGAALEHRLLPKEGVLVLEPRAKLKPEDFDAVATTVDPWVEADGGLDGIVIHAREFPGWESLGSFLRHLELVRDRHEKVKRVAIVADGKLAELIPELADHFVEAEIERFPYDDFDRALAWASGKGHG